MKFKTVSERQGGKMNSSLKVFFGVFALAMAVAIQPLFADKVTTTTTTTKTVTIREDAPIYVGPVVEAELEELTLQDFQQFGTKPPAAFDQYQEYKQEINDPANTEPQLYKMKVTRELTLADFQGSGISPKLAEVRYQAYLSGRPVEVGGTYYVYVYHTPIVRVVVTN